MFEILLVFIEIKDWKEVFFKVIFVRKMEEEFEINEVGDDKDVVENCGVFEGVSEELDKGNNV